VVCCRWTVFHWTRHPRRTKIWHQGYHCGRPHPGRRNIYVILVVNYMCIDGHSMRGTRTKSVGGPGTSAPTAIRYSFMSKSYLDSHVNAHENKKPFPCPTCDEHFQNMACLHLASQNLPCRKPNSIPLWSMSQVIQHKSLPDSTQANTWAQVS
jgi:hypothetical protein